MPLSRVLHKFEDLSDSDLVRHAAMGDSGAVSQIIKRFNQRLYRLARAVMRSNSDAEDVLQEAYLHAFANLETFRGDASLSTWLSRITLNAAFERKRSLLRLKRQMPPEFAAGGAEVIPFPTLSTPIDPERMMAQKQLLQLIEQATDELPDTFRLVFVARVIEGLSVDETASILDLQPATVRTRLHRARKMIRDRLEARVGPVLVDAFPFAGARCERMTNAVLAELKLAKDGERFPADDIE